MRSFDDSIRTRQERRRDRQAKGLGGLEVDDEAPGHLSLVLSVRRLLRLGGERRGEEAQPLARQPFIIFCTAVSSR